ncbi:MAG: glycosidase [Ilumatobacteraceae bacterium]|nr:glycosidase [Ilumatobacteraceae bacterium]
MTTAAITETGVELNPDSKRVITRFFVPGREDLGPGDSRAGPVIRRILELDEADVVACMTDLDARFAHRHRDIDQVFEQHAVMVTSRLADGVELSPARRRFLGASFTHEFSIEAAALCNPSIVLHPQQVDDGRDGVGTRFVLSARSIGEGHRSSISFRTGTVRDDGSVTIDPPGPFPHTALPTAGLHQRSVLHAKLGQLDDDRGNAAFVLDRLPEQFDDAELNARIERLDLDRATRRNTAVTVDNLRALMHSSYVVEFDDVGEISERVLWPQAPVESHGMEDARFVRFTRPDGSVTCYATYTGYDGANVCVQLLETTDFVRFRVTPMAGPAAVGKGLALFPRQIDGRYVALSRSDRETNAIAFSDDLYCWNESQTIQVPEQPWEMLQLGNCGSPIETADGWLVLTHGVGPMRTYSLGAMLLDLRDPRVVLARSVTPILVPGNDRRDGYVPNVVYTCGALAHGDVLVLPYAIADQRIRIATLSITELLATLQPVPVP